MKLGKEQAMGTKPSALRSAATATLVALGLVLVGCDQDAGSAVDDMEDGVEDAASRTGDAARSAGDAVGDAARSAGDAVGDAARQVSDKFGEAYTAAADEAAAAVKDVDGGQEALTKIKDFFRSARETLQDVADSEPSQDVMSKLEGLGDEADKVNGQIEELPGEAKTAVTDLYDKGVAHLDALMDKISSMPNVGEAVKTKLDELKAKLESL